jgi:3-methylfumaryl-CoA hydratase
LSEDFSDWIGRQELVSDVLEVSRSNALRATLGNKSALANGDELPPLFHWLYFWNVQPPVGLGADGHPAKGGFLPPIPLPRRMWAGGRVTFCQPLRLGETVTKTSTILKIETKIGKSGTLVFVTVKHELESGNGIALVEEQDLVYRAPSSGMADLATGNVVPTPAWQSEITPDPVLLFRYSALTMNGHRIHYDRPYAMEEESYPALVVHGPLQATLLADLASRNLRSPMTSFSFRGQSPAFEGATLHICGEFIGEGASLWTEQAGTKNMVATATY